jgi:glycosyltransferase involved in cell wall biosynthesis
MKLAIITCYHDPDYVRARSLRAALKLVPGVRTIVIKNRHTSVLRYPEVLWRLWQVRRHQHPDVYLLTFRGQEILPLVLLLVGRKPLIFDEFVIPMAYANGEHLNPTLTMRLKHVLARVGDPLYRLCLKRCKAILADTQAHAELSARTSNLNLRKILAVPVGTDEALFKPGPGIVNEAFRVFYYGNMLPLHGVETVIAAAEQLKDRSDIDFLLVGGNKQIRREVLAAATRGAHIEYRKWVPFAELPALMRGASLVLGGPFGDTPQAHHVITGKTYQSLACQAPTAVGAGEATGEYFIDKKNALVVAQADVTALVKTIGWAQAHPRELKDIAIAGRKLYEKEFSTAAIARRLQPVLDGLSA